MRDLVIIYKTDTQHSFASRDVIALCYDRSEIVSLITEHAAREGESIDSEQVFNLQNIKQTQGFSGEGEYDWEELPANHLL